MKILHPLFLLLAAIFASPNLAAQSCSGSAQLTITIVPLAADASGMQPCQGAPWQLTASANLSGGSLSYAWNTGDSVPTIIKRPTQSTTYVVTASDTSGCSATDSITVPAVQTIPTVLTDSTGTFSDGSGNDNYLDSTDCRWLLQPSGAISISLNFTLFDTEQGWDFVKIFDGDSTGDPLLGEFSGTNLPPQMVSTGGAMLVQFLSDINAPAAGWTANYEASFCAADLTLNGNPITPGHYVAGNSITSAGTVDGYTIVIFEAGQEVLLQAGFTVEFGADFHAFTGGDCMSGAMKPASESKE